MAQPSILTRIDLTSGVNAVEAQAVAVGDANGDGIGDAYVAFNQGGTSRLFRLSMQAPTGAIAGPPDTSTFAQRGSFTYTDGGSTSSFGLVLGDFDFDSVLARLGTTCRRVQEPTLRSLVMLPPTWSQLQSDDDSEATIGQQGTSGGSTETRFSRFQSHDVSGYIGVQVDGEPFGIGAKGSAKATFGYNFQAERGEVRGSSVETTVTEGRSEAGDRGLVVLEDNQFDCYDYDVTRGGVLAPNSDLRSCERLSQLTSVFGTNLDDWNTFRAVNTVGGQRAQWTSLEPDWASIALFVPPSPEPPAVAGFESRQATDGLFDTAYRSPPLFFPSLQIDLGEVRELTQIRVHKPIVGTTRMAMFLSESPMTGPGFPSGPGVTRIDPDPQSRNGVGTWNVRLFGPSPDFAPLRARYIRVQSIDTFTVLQINELQVFAADHKQPPHYPAAVCDPNASDDVFLARMVGPGVGPGLVYRTIQIRGRLKWLGTNQNYADCGTVAAGVPRPSIWGTTTIGVGTSATSWDLFQGTTNLVGVSSSISHSVRAGAELEFEAGAVVQAIGGGAYEFSTGVTTEESSTMEWGGGLNYGGTAAGTSGLGTNPQCGFRAHPYAYVRTERSNIGYQHQFTVVDYIVPDVPNWSRLGPNLPPQDCFPPRAEPIFGSGFEP